MPIPLNKYQEGKHIITIEKLFYEGYVEYEVRDTVSNEWFYDKEQLTLAKNDDSLIHIPFYIYR